MKTNKKRSKIASMLYIVGTFLILMTAMQSLYFLVYYSLPDNIAVRLFLNIGCLYLMMYIYYKLTKRYTNWWSAFEEEKTN